MLLVLATAAAAKCNGRPARSTQARNLLDAGGGPRRQARPPRRGLGAPRPDGRLSNVAAERARAFDELVSPCLRAASGRRWLVLLGDSLLRHMLIELATRLCTPESVRALLNVTKLGTLANYHNSRSFCVTARGGCHSVRVAATRNESLFSSTNRGCGPASASAAPSLCVVFEWSKLWKQTLRKVEQAASAESSCVWPPRALLTNVGLHEILVHGRRNAVAHMAEALPRAMRRLQRWRPGPKVVLQLVAPVDEDIVASHAQRKRLRNADIAGYNGALVRVLRQHQRTAGAPRVGWSDAFNLSRTLAARGLARSKDGIHWEQPFDAHLTPANMKVACGSSLDAAASSRQHHTSRDRRNVV